MTLRDKTSIGIPRIFDYELTADNPVGVHFALMEFLPGNTAMDAFRGWESHRGSIPHEYRYDFYSSIAKKQIDLSSSLGTRRSYPIITPKPAFY